MSQKDNNHENITLDQLAEMVAREFADIHERMATKDDIKNMATKDDIKNMATKDDIKNMATKDDIKNMATKDDIAELKQDVDLMLDRHIGTFRKDYDELASRVKKLEETVFKN